MSYKPNYTGGWKSGVSGGTPITPEALNHMESGIETANEHLLPETQAADNATFLRNDGTWQKVTPANIGARPSTWTPSAVDVGAAPATESKDYPGCYYRVVNGETEWLNPPMALGVEYRTTERYNNKAVHAKAFSGGTLANGNRYALPSAFVVRTKVLAGGTELPYNDRSQAPYAIAQVNNGYVEIYCTDDFVGSNVVIISHYTKE